MGVIIIRISKIKKVKIIIIIKKGTIDE